MEEDYLLLAQIDALITKLKRIQPLLTDKRLEPQSQSILGKFGRAITPRIKSLEGLKDSVASGKLTEEGLADVWNQYVTLSREGQLIFSQCLDFLGGIAVRQMNLEEDVCELAETMVAEFAWKTGVTWKSVMILGEERPFDDITKLTAIIRLRFPEWDVWALPFLAYEFGQLAARDEGSRQLEQYFKTKEKEIRDLVTADSLDPEVEKKLSQTIKKVRSGYKNSGNNPELVNRYVEQQGEHLRGLFADIFATFVMGPAYPYARTCLRLVPTLAWEDYPHKASSARRMSFMLETLNCMNKAEKVDTYDPGPYYGEIKRLQDLWKVTVKVINPDFTGSFSFGAPYDDWFAEAYSHLDTEYSFARFTKSDWKSAEVLSGKLLDNPALEASDTLPVIINAAWIARFKTPGRLNDIAREAMKLCKQVGRAQAAPDSGHVIPPQR